MPRFSTSFDDDQHDWIETQADKKDRSKADIVRQCVEAVRSEPERTTLNQTDARDRTTSNQGGALAELADRIDDLERRIDHIDSAPAAVADGPHSRPTTTTDAQPDERDQAGAVAVEGLLEDWPPVGAQKRDERRAAGEKALEYLRDQGQATAADFRRDVEPDHPVAGQSADTWWRKSARPAVKEAQNAGVVEFNEGNKVWEWSA